MKKVSEYKLFYISLALIAILACSTLLPGIPIAGYSQHTAPAAASFRFAYFVAQPNEMQIRDWITRLEKENVSLFAAPDRMFQKGDALPLTRFFPVFDRSASITQFSSYYSYLPNQSVPPYMRSVYAMDFANAQFFFLNEEELSKGDTTQLEWLERTAGEGGKAHRIVLLKQAPEHPRFWEAVHRARINVILTEKEAYFSTATGVDTPSGYGSSDHSGWGLWRVPDSPAVPLAFLLDGQDHRLTITLQGQDSRAFGELKQDTTNLRLAGQGLREGAYISLGSLWRYHAGGPEIKAVVPEQLDVTGETPIQERFQLPAGDWRSPQYDDLSWPVGRGLFGFSQDSVSDRIIQTVLPSISSSPTYYFRKTFAVDDDPALLTNLKLHVTYEDGFIAYLNGSELYRDGIREGLVVDRSLASPSEPVLYRTYPLKNHIGSLVKGTNTIAVEVHRSHPKSPNLLFDLSLSYEK